MLAGAPAEYGWDGGRPSLEEAKAWCARLAKSHYENFHVATFLLPRKMRPHFEAIYAYCRVSDDLGDEVADAATGTRLLGEWRGMLEEMYAAPERSVHPGFVALQETVAACGIPMQLFGDLLTAFERDQRKTRNASMAELIDYSKFSANPVGRLVLYASEQECREDARAWALSDRICMGLQLANFWQDVKEDAARGRIYLPQDLMAKFGVSEEDVLAGRSSAEFVGMMKELVAGTRAMLRDGAGLERMVDGELCVTLRLFRQGGERILDAIEAQGFDTLRGRPVVSKVAKVKLLMGALVGTVAARVGGGR